jgi:hypothetical protein
MRMGTLIHAAILEPLKPLPKLTVQPASYTNEKGETKDWHNGSKACKDWHATQKAAGIDVLTQQQFDDLNGCVNAVRSHPVASAALCDGKAEVSVFRRVELPSGRTVFCKARLDFVTSGDVIVDIKKVQSGSGSADSFKWIARDRWLHMQAAFYLDAWNAIAHDEKSEWCWVVVEEDSPHLVAVHRCDSESLARGRAEYMHRLEKYAECRESGRWPGYPQFVETINIPEHR